MKKIEHIQIADLNFEKLESKHISVLSSFESSEPELKKYLIEDAYTHQELSISTTYLWFYKNKLVGYITISMTNIEIKQNKDLRERFDDKGITYHKLPALQIGRFCIHKDYEGKGIGSIIHNIILNTSIELNEKCGCRFIYLDAKRNPKTLQFYRNKGYLILRNREKGQIPMYYDLYNLIKEYRNSKKSR